jgi:hypothetical protein
MPPGRLTINARRSIAARLVSAAVILYDIYARGRRQPVRVMEAVWPITALYTGPLGGFIDHARGPARGNGPLPAEGRLGQRVDSRERCGQLVGKPIPSRALGRRGVANGAPHAASFDLRMRRAAVSETEARVTLFDTGFIRPSKHRLALNRRDDGNRLISASYRDVMHAACER